MAKRIAECVAAVVLLGLLAIGAYPSQLGRRVPGVAYALALYKGSPVCQYLESARGLDEYLRTERVQSLASTEVRVLREDASGTEIWSTPSGKWWFPRGSSPDSVSFTIAQQELGAYTGLIIREGDVVLDCGGFVGDFALQAIRAGASKVIVVEPSAQALHCIRQNLASEIQRGVVVVSPKAVWSETGKLFLKHNVSGNPAEHSLLNGSDTEGEWVELTTIDLLVEELGLTRLDVIKLDIEGAEVNAIAGAARTMMKYRPRLAIATEHTKDIVANNLNVIRAMSRFPYEKRCGYCVPHKGEVIPQTLYFDPQ